MCVLTSQRNGSWRSSLGVSRGCVCVCACARVCGCACMCVAQEKQQHQQTSLSVRIGQIPASELAFRGLFCAQIRFSFFCVTGLSNIQSSPPLQLLLALTQPHSSTPPLLTLFPSVVRVCVPQCRRPRSLGVPAGTDAQADGVHRAGGEGRRARGSQTGARARACAFYSALPASRFRELRLIISLA